MIRKDDMRAMVKDSSIGRLLLTRRAGERIRIGSEVEIEIVKTQRGFVRLAITCPRSVPVMRGELKTEREDEPGEKTLLKSSGTPVHVARGRTDEEIEARLAAGPYSEG